MPRYTITEPHPTVVQNHYTHAGRGGAGNYFRAPATTPASGVPTTTTPTTTTTTVAAAEPAPPTTRFYSGRGGAGNSHVAPKPPAMSFDEEYGRKARIEGKAVGHVGRGGAGNVYDHTTGAISASRKTSDASSLASSSSSGSGRSGFLGRLSTTLSRNR